MEILEFTDAAGWADWLTDHHDQQAEAWVRIGKSHAEMHLPTIAETGELALCFGWIDGQRKSYDAVSFIQRYSRRRPKSSWSKVNVERAEALIAAGRMRPAGWAEIEDAKADGRWDAAYEPQRTARVTEELTAALANDARSRTAFEALGRSEQYLLMLPLLKAYTPKMREAALLRLMTRLEP
ncbi:OmdA domain containing protein [Arthrobacter psychrolactophilus]|uniref:OmdA domain containing protein n=1 Tax=Arthrobacter psychrolactophilus TaxID=92442 RepID=A0A2V5IVD7_9MICC|nr:YdeI/OmpD-associated family protein [Arthrobacter psychrolactophilus]PYI38083.1 OmdA domain containing protein [Arthrobacter psychrolactophilus]